MSRLVSPKSGTSVLIVVLIFVLAGFSRSARADSEPPIGLAPRFARVPQPTYDVRPGMSGDVFPAFANFASFQQPSDRDWGVVTVKVTNSTDRLLHERITVKVLGWSDEEVQLLEIGAGQVRQLQFAPSFIPRMYENHEIVPASARIEVTDMSGRQVFSAAVPLRIRPVDDIYWGRNFRYAKFIASWVTPHDPDVESILSLAKEFMPGRRLPGYENWKPAAAQKAATYAQASAIFRALQEKGLFNVDCSSRLGAEVNSGVVERVRMPRESIREASASCIDGAVLYASLFENLGMDPAIVLVPGHAYVGVRVAQNSPEYLYLEPALPDQTSFRVAVGTATAALAKVKPGKVITIPIRNAREAGIYPMPLPESVDAKIFVTNQQAERSSRP